MVSITKEAIPLGKNSVPLSGLLSLHQRSLLRTQDPLVLGALRSDLCLAPSAKTEICPKWISRKHSFTGKKNSRKRDRPCHHFTPQASMSLK